nr:hypothetical protein [Tanacetum cinerariifolium]
LAGIAGSWPEDIVGLGRNSVGAVVSAAGRQGAGWGEQAAAAAREAGGGRAGVWGAATAGGGAGG